PGPDAELTGIRVNHLMQIDRAIMGCRYGSTKPHRDVPLFIQLYLDGRLKLDELVTQTYPLEDFQTVVDDMHEGKLARGVLTF
ncbi:MAG: Zn-dependent alcohol dehydrogenase, partial [Acidimicrobiales bacterium]